MGATSEQVKNIDHRNTCPTICDWRLELAAYARAVTMIDFFLWTACVVAPIAMRNYNSRGQQLSGVRYTYSGGTKWVAGGI